MSGENQHPIERALSLAQLPDSLSGWRVLAVGDTGAARTRLEGLGASDFAVLEEPSEGAEVGDGFDLALCGSEAGGGIHPLALYAWLRRALKSDGVLVAGSQVIPDPKLSQYARFVPPATPEETSRWLPGRLAFRWMVEVCGFDLVSWLDDSPDGAAGTRAYLQAKAVQREPALDLARQPLGR
jgi:hypothetical protein